MAIVHIRLTGESRKSIQRMKLRGDKLIAGLRPAAEKAGTLLASEIAAKQLSGQKLKVVTSMLRSSMASRVIGSGARLAVMVGITKGPATKYARIHELGGTIKAKPGKALAIPLDDAKTGSGRPKYPHGPSDPRVKRDFPGGTFLIKDAGKPPIIAGRKAASSGGSKVRIYFLFVLVKSVRMPAKRYLATGVREGIDVFRVSLAGDIHALLQ